MRFQLSYGAGPQLIITTQNPQHFHGRMDDHFANSLEEGVEVVQFH
jgi:hypothetical protein